MLARGARRDESRHGNIKGLVSLDTSPFCVLLATRSRTTAWLSNTRQAVSVLAVFADTNFVSRQKFPGRVGEWLKPADCKSAAPCGLRRFESFPVHQALAVRVAENRGAIASSDVRKRSDSGRRPICGRNGKNDAAQEKCAAKDDF